MAETKPPEKKNLLKRITDAVPDREEQFELVSLGVRLSLLLWATAMLSLSYLDLSKLGIPQQKIDPTFIASVFVGLASSFGASITQKGEKGSNKNGTSTKEELKQILGNTQLIRIETPIKIIPQEGKLNPEKSKRINDLDKL
jgi:hypothetical protein